MKPPGIRIAALSAEHSGRTVLRDVTLEIKPGQVTAIIGPSGCGKTTLVRCINRMHELHRRARVTGVVELDGEDIYAPSVDPAQIRRRVGMVLQSPQPFPHLSIRDNVLAGLKLSGQGSQAEDPEIVRHALQRAALWDEVKTRLDEPGTALALGQQQRLCIARTLAVDPQVLLMDEPCASLDPVATARIEDLIHSLRDRYTVVIVTHSMQQAARVSDTTAFLLEGELIESAPTSALFTQPGDKRTEDYITGKFS